MFNQSSIKKFYEEIRKEINCSALFSNENIDAPSEFADPPREIPTYLWVNDEKFLNENIETNCLFMSKCSQILHPSWVLEILNSKF